MSISAIINKVIPQENGDILLDLIGHRHGETPGQRHLTIIKATYTPPVGAGLWGGSDSCILELGEGKQKKYKRVGYVQLEEDF